MPDSVCMLFYLNKVTCYLEKDVGFKCVRGTICTKTLFDWHFYFWIREKCKNGANHSNKTEAICISDWYILFNTLYLPKKLTNTTKALMTVAVSE